MVWLSEPIVTPNCPAALVKLARVNVAELEYASMTDIVAGRYDAGIRFGKRIARDMIAVSISDKIRHVVVASQWLMRQRGSAVS